MTNAIKHFASYWRQLPVRWLVIALFAIPITYADGFWMTALQGAIGAIERNEPPFFRWLRDATFTLPLVFLAMLVAFLCARRWFGNQQRKLVRFWGIALVVALISGSVGIAEAGISALNDYRYQVHHLELMHSYGTNTQLTSDDLTGLGSTSYYLYCDIRTTLIGGSASSAAVGSAVTRLEYATFVVHVRALVLDTALVLMTNLMIVALLLAVLGERLWARGLVANPQISEATNQLATGGTLV